MIFLSSTSSADQWAEAVFQFVSSLLFGQALRRIHSLYDAVYFLAEKGFHIALFAGLAVLLWMALLNRSKRIVFLLLICIAVGSISETLQLFFPGRDPTVRDVLINIAGAGLGSAIMIVRNSSSQPDFSVWHKAAMRFATIGVRWRKPSDSVRDRGGVTGGSE